MAYSATSVRDRGARKYAVVVAKDRLSPLRYRAGGGFVIVLKADNDITPG